jgi:hypothetical protein
VKAPHVQTQLCLGQPTVPTNSARKRRNQRPVISFVYRILCAVAFVLLININTAPAEAESVSKEQMQSLDEQVQEIKSDALNIAAELSGLEEKLLYPSNTQVAVFVSLEEGEAFRLDSVQILIDGEQVAHYIYSFKELEALKKGGVQRIYTGNIPTGEHQLDVSVAGKLSGGRDLDTTESFSFRKDVEPKLVAITLAGQDSSEPRIELGGW